MVATAPLKRTPLYEAHVAAGGRLVEFVGWEMPVQYEGVRAEHLAVRSGCGVFDVSHMGEIETRGPGAGRTAACSTTCSPTGSASSAF